MVRTAVPNYRAPPLSFRAEIRVAFRVPVPILKAGATQMNGLAVNLDWKLNDFLATEIPAAASMKRHDPRPIPGRRTFEVQPVFRLQSMSRGVRC
jgi:hypothetical protein